MSGDKPYGPRPVPTPAHIRADAIAYIGRTQPDADLLLAAFGLTEADEPRDADGRKLCEACGNPLPDPIANGGAKPCRRRACQAARTAPGSRTHSPPDGDA